MWLKRLIYKMIWVSNTFLIVYNVVRIHMLSFATIYCKRMKDVKDLKQDA